jgi:hypothetical protein
MTTISQIYKTLYTHLDLDNLAHLATLYPTRDQLQTHITRLIFRQIIPRLNSPQVASTKATLTLSLLDQIDTRVAFIWEEKRTRQHLRSLP